MRRLGYRTVDMLVDRLSAVADGPLIRRATRPEMEQRLTEPSPEAAQGFDGIHDRLGADVLSFASLTGHSRYFAFIPGCATWPGALGDLIANVSNIENSWWLESARASSSWSCSTGSRSGPATRRKRKACW
jgi:hypothetical protein